MRDHPSSLPLSLPALLKETVREWSAHKSLRLSAALAYYAIFSIAPLLLVCLAIAGWLYGPDAARGHLDDQLRSVLGSKVAEGVQAMVSDAREPSSSLAAGILGTLVMLLGAGGIFAQLKDALNTIWDVRPSIGYGLLHLACARLVSFGMVLVIGLLLLASVAMTTTLSGLTERLAAPPLLTTGLATLLSLTTFTLLFAAVFKILPDTHVGWRDVWIGAAFTALLFEAGKFGLGYYLGRESTASAYGAAASLVLVLLWIYYASLILFFGAAFTKVYARIHGTRAAPSPPPATPLQETRVTPHPVAAAAQPLSLLILGTATGLVAGLLLRHTRLPSTHAHSPHHRRRGSRHSRLHQS